MCNHIARQIEYSGDKMRGTPGQDLRALRERRKLTLKELARRAGLSFSQIATIERGGNTTIERIDLLAQALGAEVTVAVYEPGERSAVLLPREVAEAAQSIDQAPAATRELLLALAGVADQMRPEVRDMLAALVRRLERDEVSPANKATRGNQ